MSAEKKISNIELGAVLEVGDADLTEKMFKNFSEKMFHLAGVDLPYTPKNVALLRNRIIKLLRKKQLRSYDEYWSILQKGDKAEINDFISALTTNMTSFFRESSHFDWLADYCKSYPKNKDLRIWCAAASTGQEPYTISIVLNENLDSSSLKRSKILATDIDLQVLKRGSVGFYDDKDMSGLSMDLKKKYFDKSGRSVSEGWRAKDEIHKVLTFAQFNLMSPSYSFKAPFDVIFCRNVLIYFNEETTKKVIDNLVTALAPGAFLILGHSESGNIRHPKLKPLSRAIYQKI